eukprot:TRINITY_DN17592_c1_g1_i1.p1 TRINITY_DN17592_c1_g1~~TRINITY_DN17592_c1_g1_i1.p1  ORF type:complete len:1105 (+),score=227.32 TRINITY_DN17592_c1_g1_i1:67-3381(+)
MELQPVQAPKGLKQFQNPELMYIRMVNKHSSKGKRQKRVLVVTPKTFVVCEKGQQVKRYFHIEQIKEILWQDAPRKEGGMEKKIVVRIDGDLEHDLAFAQCNDSCNPPGSSALDGQFLEVIPLLYEAKTGEELSVRHVPLPTDVFDEAENKKKPGFEDMMDDRIEEMQRRLKAKDKRRGQQDPVEDEEAPPEEEEEAEEDGEQPPDLDARGSGTGGPPSSASPTGRGGEYALPPGGGSDGGMGDDGAVSQQPSKPDAAEVTMPAAAVSELLKSFGPALAQAMGVTQSMSAAESVGGTEPGSEQIPPRQRQMSLGQQTVHSVPGSAAGHSHAGSRQTSSPLHRHSSRYQRGMTRGPSLYSRAGGGSPCSQALQNVSFGRPSPKSAPQHPRQRSGSVCRRSVAFDKPSGYSGSPHHSSPPSPLGSDPGSPFPAHSAPGRQGSRRSLAADPAIVAQMRRQQEQMERLEELILMCNAEQARQRHSSLDSFARPQREGGAQPELGGIEAQLQQLAQGMAGLQRQLAEQNLQLMAPQRQAQQPQREPQPPPPQHRAHADPVAPPSKQPTVAMAPSPGSSHHIISVDPPAPSSHASEEPFSERSADERAVPLITYHQQESSCPPGAAPAVQRPSAAAGSEWPPPQTTEPQWHPGCPPDGRSAPLPQQQHLQQRGSGRRASHRSQGSRSEARASHAAPPGAIPPAPRPRQSDGASQGTSLPPTPVPRRCAPPRREDTALVALPIQPEVLPAPPPLPPAEDAALAVPDDGGWIVSGDHRVTPPVAFLPAGKYLGPFPADQPTPQLSPRQLALPPPPGSGCADQQVPPGEGGDPAAARALSALLQHLHQLVPAIAGGCPAPPPPHDLLGQPAQAQQPPAQQPPVQQPPPPGRAWSASPSPSVGIDDALRRAQRVTLSQRAHSATPPAAPPLCGVGPALPRAASLSPSLASAQAATAAMRSAPQQQWPPPPAAPQPLVPPYGGCSQCALPPAPLLPFGAAPQGNCRRPVSPPRPGAASAALQVAAREAADAVAAIQASARRTPPPPQPDSPLRLMPPPGVPPPPPAEPEEEQLAKEVAKLADLVRLSSHFLEHHSTCSSARTQRPAEAHIRRAGC